MEQDINKIGKEFFGIKILSPLEIFNIDKNAIIFISHPQIENGVKTLTDLGFKNIYTCIDLWKFHDFNNSESFNFLDNIILPMKKLQDILIIINTMF